jgi:putative transposase
MPWSLRRPQQTGHLHFLTFSCYRRLPKLGTRASRERFEASLESTRVSYELSILGYVVMPEHVHLLVTEPASQPLSKAVQALKQSVSRQLGNREPFWQVRYYDFNVFTERKRIQKLRYMHRNPVMRDLARRPEDWPWSSFQSYATGLQRTVTISLPASRVLANEDPSGIDPIATKPGAPS